MVAVFFGGEPRDSEFAAVDAQPRNVHGFRRCGVCNLNDLLKVFVGLRLARARVSLKKVLVDGGGHGREHKYRDREQLGERALLVRDDGRGREHEAAGDLRTNSPNSARTVKLSRNPAQKLKSGGMIGGGTMIAILRGKLRVSES